jgi:hypothetical protein
MTNEDYRARLQFALLQICAFSPPGLFPWLEKNDPRYHRNLTRVLPDRINASWGESRQEFDAAIGELLLSISAAIPVYELWGKP